MNIIQAITIAGGFTRTAWRNRTNVTRIVGGEEQKIQVPVEAIGEGTQKNFALKPGDIIFVPESPL
jgi:polysaccharide export outer membrane protein